MNLSRDDILKADDLETREVDVPEWGGTVLVRALSGTDRDAYEASMVQIRGNQPVADLANTRAKLVGRCLIDEDGNRLFTDQDINALGKKSAAVLDRLFDIAAELSGMTPESVDELGKDSEPDRNGSSTSGSPENSGAPSLSS